MWLQVLVALAALVRACSASYEPSCVARSGADELAVLCEAQDGAAEVGDLSQLARDIRSAVESHTFTSVKLAAPVQVRVSYRYGPDRRRDVSELVWQIQRNDRRDIMRELEQRLEAIEKLTVGIAEHQDLRQADLRTRLAHAERRARRDHLTGALNRNGYVDLMRTLAPPYALAFVDVDNLRELNKAAGENWAGGDQALVGVAGLLTETNPAAVVVRWGGDEFLVILPAHSAAQGKAALDHGIREARHKLRVGDQRVSFSAGVAHVSDNADHDRALASAQRAAQRAKQQRGVVLLADGQDL